MAAQNISTGALNDIQILLSDMFSGDTPSKYPMRDFIGSARAILENNDGTPSTKMIMADGECIGTQVHWLTKGATTETYTGTGSSPSLTLNCDLATGEGAIANAQTYENNIVKVYNVNVKDNECGNIWDFQTLSAHQLARAMFDARASLNGSCISFLDASKSAVNNDDDVTDGNVDGVSFAASTFSVSETVLPWNTPDSLTVLDTIVANNAMDTSFWVGGRNSFYNAIVNSEYRRLNDNERDLVRFDNYNMWFDVKNLDNTLTGKNLFAVGVGSYLFWNTEVYESTQFEQIDYDKWVALIPDPILRYKNAAGALVPVMYNVVYQKACSSRNSDSLKHQMLHKWEVRLQGGLVKAPASEDNHTGILKFQAV
jgi:hypothetical protein